MASEFKDHIRLGNLKKLQSRNAAGSNWVDLCWLDANNDLVLDAELSAAKLKNAVWLKGRNAADGADVNLFKLDASDDRVVEVKEKVVRHEFDRMGRPVAVKADGGGAPTGAAGDENLLMWPGLMLEYHILGTQSDVAPEMTTVGLDIGSMDQTANDGLELCPGISSKHDMRFVVGTDAAFYMEAKVKIADVSGTDDFAIGFRKVEAYQANVDDYDEMAALNIIAGDVNIETILNGGGTTTTDTTNTHADLATASYKVLVSAAGVVTYQIDDAAPVVVAAFTFDDGEVLVPFIYFLFDTTTPGVVELIHLEVGHQ